MSKSPVFKEGDLCIRKKDLGVYRIQLVQLDALPPFYKIATGCYSGGRQTYSANVYQSVEEFLADYEVIGDGTGKMSWWWKLREMITNGFRSGLA